jgi:hypothetical protein
MAKAKLSETEKNEEYGKGVRDAQAGEFNPPQGDTLTDIVFGPLDAVSGTPSTHEVAEAQSKPYREGHSSGSHGPKKEEDDKEDE